MKDVLHKLVQQDMMDAMDKMSFQFIRGHQEMKENNAIIRNGITELIISRNTSSPSTIKTGSRNWASVAAMTPAALQSPRE